MVWIRVDATLAREKFIGALAEALDLDIPTAIGLWVSTHLGFAEHERSGAAPRVSNTSIEQWAGWRGPRGAYAAAFRAHCVETDDGKLELPGTIRGWALQEALMKKAEADAERLRLARAAAKAGGQSCVGSVNVADASHDESATNPPTSRPRRSNVARNVDVDGNGNILTTTTPLEYVQRCVIACNTGLGANPNMRGFNELSASEQDVQVEWIRDGIPLDLAERVIFERAAKYRPVGTRRRQPTTLRYFDQAVRSAFEDAAAKKIEPSANLTAAMRDRTMTEGERLAADLKTGD